MDIKIGDRIKWCRLQLKSMTLIWNEGTVVASPNRTRRLVKTDDGKILSVNTSSISRYRHSLTVLS